jgi:adenine nucleotide transporter 17
LADAVSGVAGSLVSLWTFYPIEVWKTNMQAGDSSRKRSMFLGCRAKTLHTASSNFCYFFLYSWIFSKWEKQNPSANKKIHPATRLLLSAIAAMLNTMITLPLDVISSKQVTQREEDKDRDEPIRENKNDKMDKVWCELQDNESSDLEFQECVSVFQEEKKVESSSCINENEQQPLESSCKSLEVSEADQHWSSLWKGLAPALLLCSNPSINYTVYDLTKNRILGRRHRTDSTLSMPEAFLVGLFAKFIATIATYPLIRAKVILMVTSEKSLIASLCRSYREDGIRGLYKGCNWQLLHTLLKSGLMMTVREKISSSTQRLIAGDVKKR